MADIKHQELPVRDELRAIRERCAEYPVLAPAPPTKFSATTTKACRR